MDIEAAYVDDAAVIAVATPIGSSCSLPVPAEAALATSPPVPAEAALAGGKANQMKRTQQ